MLTLIRLLRVISFQTVFLPLIAAAGLVRYSRIVFLSGVNDCSAICLETKEPKIQVSPKASLPHRPYAAKRAEPGPESFYPVLRRSFPVFSKNFLCPTAAHATIVLPFFTRSCRADEK